MSRRGVEYTMEEIHTLCTAQLRLMELANCLSNVSAHKAELKAIRLVDGGAAVRLQDFKQLQAKALAWGMGLVFMREVR